jgi:hypothetical protein
MAEPALYWTLWISKVGRLQACPDSNILYFFLRCWRVAEDEIAEEAVTNNENASVVVFAI